MILSARAKRFIVCRISCDDSQCLFSLLGTYEDVSLQARVRLLQSRAEVTGRLCLITRGARWTLASSGQVAHTESGGHAWPLVYLGGPKIGFGVGCAGAHVSMYAGFLDSMLIDKRICKSHTIQKFHVLVQKVRQCKVVNI